MTIKLLSLGTTARISIQVKDTGQNCALIDPSTLVINVVDPAGVKTTYTYGSDEAVVRTGVGKFYVEFVVSISGVWSYDFATTGPVVGADNGTFSVGLDPAA